MNVPCLATVHNYSPISSTSVDSKCRSCLTLGLLTTIQRDSLILIMGRENSVIMTRKMAASWYIWLHFMCTLHKRNALQQVSSLLVLESCRVCWGPLSWSWRAAGCAGVLTPGPGELGMRENPSSTALGEEVVPIMLSTLQLGWWDDDVTRSAG